MTEIATIGEFGLIDRLTKAFPSKAPSTIIGVGDDCAVVNHAPQHTLVTAEMLMEGVHFDLTYIDMQHLGYKAAMMGMSDIFAMNGKPTELLVGIAMGKRTTVEHLDELYAGLRMAADKWGAHIVGGDTTSSYTGLAISITCIGEANPEDIVQRSGARETDLLCVSGDLGAAYMGLQLLEREKAVYYQQLKEAREKGKESPEQFTPDFAGREYLIERQLKPEARGDIIAQLREAGIRPTAMIDVTDGLASELLHLCKQGGVGCRVYEDKIPIDYQTAVTCEEFNMNLTTAALHGGEDLELLFTIPIGDYERVKSITDVKQIGYITRPELGACLVSRDGAEFALTAQGFPKDE